MKQFLFRLLQFAAFFPLMLLVASVGILHDRYVAEKSSLAMGKTIVICGNSLPQTAIDDAACDDVFNWAAQAEKPFQGYVKLRRLFRDNKQIKFLLYGVGAFYHTESAIYSDPDETFCYLADLIPLLKVDDLETIRHIRARAWIHPLRKALKNGWRNFFTRISSKHLLARWGGTIKLWRPKNSVYGKYFNYDAHSLADEAPCRYFYKIKELCEENNIVFVFLKIPVYKRGECAEGAARFEAQRAQYEKYFPDVPVFDLSECDFPQEYYHDYKHLNVEGQREFTKIFNERLPEFLSSLDKREGEGSK